MNPPSRFAEFAVRSRMAIGLMAFEHAVLATSGAPFRWTPLLAAFWDFCEATDLDEWMTRASETLPGVVGTWESPGD